MDEYKTFGVSDKFKEAVAKSIIGKAKYPWERLEVGQSFSVSFNDINHNSLVSLAFKAGKRSNKKFKVVRHDDAKVYEVGRLPDSEIRSYKAKNTKPAVNPLYLERNEYGTRIRDDNGDYTKEFHEEGTRLRGMSKADREKYDASFGITNKGWGTPVAQPKQVEWPLTWSAQPINDKEEEGE